MKAWIVETLGERIGEGREQKKRFMDAKAGEDRATLWVQRDGLDGVPSEDQGAA